MRRRLQWAGHVDRMAYDMLQKRAAELGEQEETREAKAEM